MTIADLLSKEIEWQRDSSRTDHFHAHVDHELILLRINNFPEEPFCTVILDGKEHDLEDTGKNWRVPWWKKDEVAPGSE